MADGICFLSLRRDPFPVYWLSGLFLVIPYPEETIYRKYQSLFSGEDNRKYFKISSAELFTQDASRYYTGTNPNWELLFDDVCAL